MLPAEIELGRSVPANWDTALFEPYAARKARLAREREGDDGRTLFVNGIGWVTPPRGRG